MSVQALSAAFALHVDSPTAKLVLLALANFADADGRCWPSQKTLGGLTSLSERAVRNAIDALASAGHLSKVARRRADGSRASDIITLVFVQPASTAACYQPAPNAGSEPPPINRHVVPEQPAPRAPPPAPRAGLTTFEPSIEPTSEAKASSVRVSPKATKRCPETWEPTQEDRAVGVSEGFSPGAIERELAKFRDHTFHTARADWSATFRNWLRKASPNERRRASAKSADHAERMSDIGSAMATPVLEPSGRRGGR